MHRSRWASRQDVKLMKPRGGFKQSKASMGRVIVEYLVSSQQPHFSWYRQVRSCSDDGFERDLAGRSPSWFRLSFWLKSTRISSASWTALCRAVILWYCTGQTTMATPEPQAWLWPVNDDSCRSTQNSLRSFRNSGDAARNWCTSTRIESITSPRLPGDSVVQEWPCPA